MGKKSKWKYMEEAFRGELSTQSMEITTLKQTLATILEAVEDKRITRKDLIFFVGAKVSGTS